MALAASPARPLRWQRPRCPSVFMWPILLQKSARQSTGPRLLRFFIVEGRRLVLGVGRQLRMNPGQIQDFCNPPDLVILRNGLLEIEAIEQLALIPIEPPHHRPISQKAVLTRPNHDSAAASKRLLQQNRPITASMAERRRSSRLMMPKMPRFCPEVKMRRGFGVSHDIPCRHSRVRWRSRRDARWRRWQRACAHHRDCPVAPWRGGRTVRRARGHWWGRWQP
jgi:hypothetical protein